MRCKVGRQRSSAFPIWRGLAISLLVGVAALSALSLPFDGSDIRPSQAMTQIHHEDAALAAFDLLELMGHGDIVDYFENLSWCDTCLAPREAESIGYESIDNGREAIAREAYLTDEYMDVTLCDLNWGGASSRAAHT